MKYLRSFIVTYLVTTIIFVQASFDLSKLATIHNACQHIRTSRDFDAGIIADRLQHYDNTQIDTIMKNLIQESKTNSTNVLTMNQFYDLYDTQVFGQKVDQNITEEDLQRIAYYQLGQAAVRCSYQDEVVTRVNMQQRDKKPFFVERILTNSENLNKKMTVDQISCALAGAIAQEVLCNNNIGDDYESDLKKIFFNVGASGISNKFFNYGLSRRKITDPSIEDCLFTFDTLHYAYELHNDTDLYFATRAARSIVRSQENPGVMRSAGLWIASKLSKEASLVFTTHCPLVSPDRAAEKAILLEACKKAKNIIIDNKPTIENLAQELVTNKTLSGQRLYNDLAITRPAYWFEEYVITEDKNSVTR